MVVHLILINSREKDYDFKTNRSPPNYYYSSVLKGVVMDTKQKKHTPLFSGMVPGTQERATELNNGGATQIVLNRRVKRARGNKSNLTSSKVNKDG